MVYDETLAILRNLVVLTYPEIILAVVEECRYADNRVAHEGERHETGGGAGNEIHARAVVRHPDVAVGIYLYSSDVVARQAEVLLGKLGECHPRHIGIAVFVEVELADAAYVRRNPEHVVGTLYNLHDVVARHTVGVVLLVLEHVEGSFLRVEGGHSLVGTHPDVLQMVYEHGAHVVARQTVRVLGIVLEETASLGVGVVDDESLHAESDIEISLAVVGDASHAIVDMRQLLLVYVGIFPGQRVVVMHAAIVVGKPDGGISRHADVGYAVHHLAVDFEVREGLRLAVEDVGSSILGVYPDGVALRMIQQSHVLIVGDGRVGGIEVGALVAGDAVESPFGGNPYESLSVDDHVIHESIG